MGPQGQTLIALWLFHTVENITTVFFIQSVRPGAQAPGFTLCKEMSFENLNACWQTADLRGMAEAERFHVSGMLDVGLAAGLGCTYVFSLLTASLRAHLSNSI